MNQNEQRHDGDKDDNQEQPQLWCEGTEDDLGGLNE